MRRLGLPRQQDLYRVGGIARTRPFAFEPQAAVALVDRFIHVEIGIDRIHRDDRRQQGGATLTALHKIAHRHQVAADSAVDRSLDLGVFDIELGSLQGAFGLEHGGLGGLQCLTALVDDTFGGELRFVQLGGAGEFALRQIDPRLGVGQLSLRLLGDRLVLPGIDHVEQIAGLDHGAVLELDAGDEARDAGANLHLFDGVEPSGEFIPIRHRALGRLCNSDGRCGRRGLLGVVLAASRKGKHRNNWAHFRDSTKV